MQAKIDCSFLGINLKNPLVLASGVLGTSASLLQRVAEAGAGAVTAKSCSLEPREGHPNPVSVAWKHGMINAIGLTNPGVEEECKVLAEASVILKKKGVLLFASIFGGKIEDYGRVAARISEAQPDLIEVNISCPNVADEFGTPFAADEKSAAAVTRAVRKATQLRIAVKLTPNTPAIGRIARAAVEEGADAITAINTVPGVVIDAFARRPVLFNRMGGISGGAIKPVALRCVMEIARAVNVPIIGTGGVETGLDAVEMIMAGATLVGIGAAVAIRGVDVFRQVNEEIIQFMQSEKITSLEEIHGAALK
jgi:dihydroorotate dehydrogenase (NAD+) catalytic subunit